MDGLLATRSVLPTHTSDRGTDHSESHLYSHGKTSSAKALAWSPTTPVPAAAPPGVSRLTQATFTEDLRLEGGPETCTLLCLPSHDLALATYP